MTDPGKEAGEGVASRPTGRDAGTDIDAGLLASGYSRADILKKGLVLGAGATALGALGSDALVAPARAYRGAVSKDTVRVACAGPVLGLDPDNPASAFYVPSIQAINACYDSLTKFAMFTTMAAATAASKGIGIQPKPQLSPSWTTSRDGKTVTFKLRRGVKSSFGNELKAENVLWTIAKSLATNRGGAGHLRANGISEPGQVVALDDYTVQFRTTGQFRLPLTLGYFFFPIYDIVEVKKHIKPGDPWAQEWLNTNTAGFGPYVISDFGHGGNTVKFTARDDYWGPKPTKNVVYQNVGDPSSRLQLLLRGEVDYAEGLSALQLKQVARNSKTSLVSLLSVKGAQLSMSWEQEPWNNAKIRQAIAKAMPYQSIVKLVYQNLPPARQAKSPLTPFVQGWTEKFGYKTDMRAARAGLSSIAGANLQLAYDVSSPTDELIGILVQNALRQVGITVSFRPLPRSLYLQLYRSTPGGLPNQVNTADASSFPMPAYYFEQIFYKPSIQNFSNYANATTVGLVRRLSDLAKSGQGNSKQARALTTRLQQIYMRDLPTIPLVWAGDARGVAKGLRILQAIGGTTQIYWQDLRWS